MIALISCLQAMGGGSFDEERFFEGDWVDRAGSSELTFPDRVFDVRDYGIHADGIFPDTEGLQRAIDDCAATGGGVVRIPDGKYLTGSLFLRSGVHLKLEEGAVLLASLNLSDYPEQWTRVAGIELQWPMALLNVLDAEGVMISGKGSIHGQGKSFWQKFHTMKPHYEQAGLRWALDYDCKRPRLLVVSGSRDVILRDFTLRESPFWTVQILYSRHVTVDGLTIRNRTEEHAPSSDGINVDSSEFILIQNNDVECQDDNFCVKAGRDADGLRVNRASAYLVYRNNTARYGAGMIVFGSETSGGIHHVYISGMRALGTVRGIRFKSARTRGGFVKDILIENVEIRDSPFIFEFTMNWNPEYSYARLPAEYHNRSIPEHWVTLLKEVKPVERGICQLEKVLMRNVRVSGKCWKAFNVEGFPEAPIRDFVFENVELHTETAGSIHHARAWTAKASQFNFSDRTPPELVDCSDMINF